MKKKFVVIKTSRSDMRPEARVGARVVERGRLKVRRSAPAIRGGFAPERAVTPLDIEPKQRPVEKSASSIQRDRERQQFLEHELEQQAVAKRRAQLASAGNRLGHLTGRPADPGRAERLFDEN